MERISSLLSSLRTLETGTLDQEYNMVRSQTSLLKRDLSLTTEAGALKENMKKNRYKDILPYDQSRVVLSLLTSDSDYINASFIQGATSDCRYIACQGPLGSTLTDFWRMIWENNVKVIVMACREIEMGKKKCECYWSPLHQSASFGPFTVCNEKLHPDEDVVVRALKVSFQQDSRSVTQYQFLSWPDHDVPFEASGVLDLLERVRESRGADTSPLLVHCSAGCGRTGVICALDYIHDLLVNEHSDFSIMQIVKEIRRQRPSAVQTKEQYRFIFTAAAAMLERELLCCNTSEVKTHNGSRGERKRPTPSSKRQQIAMNDTYAVVNKPKHPPSDPASSAVDTPRFSRTPPPSHHYDNDPSRASAAPVYSAVKPRAKPHGSPLSATPLYDMPANHRLGDSGEHHLSPAGGLSLTDDDYEDFCPSAPDASGRGSPGGIGFNCRIQKPRGPRDPPADWRDELV
ncbi:tyrosine-protein phosphatase non-receptor type 18 isoform X2 [Cyclopterus lumpus]|uniref:tyrosine-protein phosphatase non-receptor type 18 isoform X2 n=1 Tax=Cyclopterus lumpus TaxID=8103 RepID=UPI001486BD80|nr:tyrosine-protein phosphatase non-receptor type 18 isoform X2 [Cyclopterus lumpus]